MHCLSICQNFLNICLIFLYILSFICLQSSLHSLKTVKKDNLLTVIVIKEVILQKFQYHGIVLYDWLINSGNMQKRRPCTFGQSLGRPIVQSFSHFFWSPKKNCPVSGNFWSGSDFFGQPNFFLVYQNFFLVYQKIRA